MKTKTKFPSLPKYLITTIIFMIGGLAFPQFFLDTSPVQYAITLVLNGVINLGFGLYHEKKLPTSIGLASFLMAFPIVYLGFAQAPYWVLSALFLLPTKLRI